MYFDRLVITFIVAGYFLSPIVMDWVSQGGSQWYRPYVVWLLFIVIAFWVTRGRDINDL